MPQSFLDRVEMQLSRNLQVRSKTDQVRSEPELLHALLQLLHALPVLERTCRTFVGFRANQQFRSAPVLERTCRTFPLRALLRLRAAYAHVYMNVLVCMAPR